MRLALGTVQFGLDYGISNQAGQVSRQEVEAILERAQQLGISLLDSASAYGNSEQVLGNTDSSKQFEVVTKIPRLSDDVTTIVPFIEQSLTNLKRQQLDAVLFHHADDLIEHKNRNLFYQELIKLRASGVIKRIGASLYQVNQWQQLKNQYSLDVLQVPVNCFDQRFVCPTLLAEFSEYGVKLHCRSAFLQGLLLMPAAQRPHYFDDYQIEFNRFEHLATKYQCSWLTLCFVLFHQLTGMNKNAEPKACQKLDDKKTILSTDVIEQIVVGCCNTAQLNEIADAYRQAKTINIDNELLRLLASTEQTLINPSLWQVN
ncbi:aldo/keto reductase [Endozoicomonas sp. G2_1]|uniref:aldo/keto reductase n=1 Tax=Endozoicomonas sp. G2_1 TaxID=2821091 RepID=UPI001ADC25EA|nr:aldo/keto reductase [Endozoicomonas sp. G2_1]